MSEPEADRNLRVYDAPEVASHYAALDYLTDCERLLFETYIPPGCSVLDLGVGGGRTTPYLAKRAARYVGADYAPSMVKACQAKFPGLEFVVADATDLSAFSKSSFDVVVFAFNGIDCIVGEQSRRKCLEEIRRLLKMGGVVIFSSHNPRAVLVRTGWDHDRLRQMARRLSGNSENLRLLLKGSLVFTRLFVALAKASWATMKRATKRIPSRMFWRGEGELLDPAHGGLLTHYQTPDKLISELSALRFRPECVVGDDYPRRNHPFATDWYYYVFAKTCEK
jgi:ubiquinone/menaquinone biosynthesis C-methylase UbiE